MKSLVENIPDGAVYRTLAYYHPSLHQHLLNYRSLIFADQSVPEHLAYICPLCLENYFVWVSPEMWVKGEFTIEHVPPESVGGTKLLPTCKKCNNDAGSTYESELKTKMHFEASMNAHPDTFIIANFETSSIDTSKRKIKALVAKNEEGTTYFDFYKKAKENDPQLKHWLEYVLQREGISAELTITNPDNTKILNALLKSAYLFCFYHWGYDFAYSSNAGLIREVLKGKAIYARNTHSFWFDKTHLTKEGSFPPLGLCMIKTPVELRTFIVNFPLVYKDYIAVASIVIPYNGEKGWKKLEEMNNFVPAQEYQITFTPLPVDLASGILDGYTQRSKLFD